MSQPIAASATSAINQRVRLASVAGSNAGNAKRLNRSPHSNHLAFFKDPQQRFIFLADGTNEKVRVIVRKTMTELTNFRDGGRQPGQFYCVHSIATDSKGNIYTTETYQGKRLQKFVYKGIGTVPREQGSVCPRRR
jgi:hypothetical protein